MELLRPEWAYILLGLLALSIGSLLNVIIHRLPIMLNSEWKQECANLLRIKSIDPPKGFNLFFPRSHCPKCNTPLRFRDNIPLLSYLFLKGCCHHCNHRISIRYPLVELLSLTLITYAAWFYGFNPHLLFACGFIWITIAITFIDIDEQLIPDSLSYALLWLGLLANSFHLYTNLNTAVYSAIAAWFLLWGLIKIYYLITGKIGMGHGDFKLFAAFGAWFGWTQLPLILLLSSLIGAIFGIVYLGYSKQHKDTPIPFGPFLCFAGLFCLFWGKTTVDAYLNLYT